VFRLLLGWRWWPAVIVAALAGVLLPAHFFAVLPHGTVSAQIWAVAWKLVATYVLVISSWVLLLAWAAVLLDRRAPDSNDDGDELGEPVAVGSGPLGEDAVRLPLPENGDDA
jgi:membrane protein implicated in regulation of membrane protease activity